MCARRARSTRQHRSLIPLPSSIKCAGMSAVSEMLMCSTTMAAGYYGRPCSHSCRLPRLNTSPARAEPALGIETCCRESETAPESAALSAEEIKTAPTFSTTRPAAPNINCSRFSTTRRSSPTFLSSNPSGGAESYRTLSSCRIHGKTARFANRIKAEELPAVHSSHYLRFVRSLSHSSQASVRHRRVQ
jgi:hypothetical protein